MTHDARIAYLTWARAVVGGVRGVALAGARARGEGRTREQVGPSPQCASRPRRRWRRRGWSRGCPPDDSPVRVRFPPARPPPLLQPVKPYVWACMTIPLGCCDLETSRRKPGGRAQVHRLRCPELIAFCAPVDLFPSFYIPPFLAFLRTVCFELPLEIACPLISLRQYQEKFSVCPWRVVTCFPSASPLAWQGLQPASKQCRGYSDEARAVTLW